MESPCFACAPEHGKHDSARKNRRKVKPSTRRLTMARLNTIQPTDVAHNNNWVYPQSQHELVHLHAMLCYARHFYQHMHEHMHGI